MARQSEPVSTAEDGVIHVEDARADGISRELALDTRPRAGAHAIAERHIVDQATDGGCQSAGVAGRDEWPLMPSSTSSGTPPTRVATTGTPKAIASSAACAEILPV